LTPRVERETASKSPHRSKSISALGTETQGKTPRSSRRGSRKFSSVGLGLEKTPMSATTPGQRNASRKSTSSLLDDMLSEDLHGSSRKFLPPPVWGVEEE
jgi:hypothetical protein